MKFMKIAAAILASLLLCGCTAQGGETTLPSQPRETIPTTIQTLPPETTMPTEPPTEPEPELEAGCAVVVDGDTLVSGSVIYEDVTYVRAGEFLAALDDGECSGDDETGFSLIWHGKTYTCAPEQEELRMDGETVSLSTPILPWHGAIWLPLEELCGAMNISLLPDGGENTLYCTAIAVDWDYETGVNIPILMYHGITDDTWGVEELFVSPSDFEDQVKYLVENGYDTITFEDFTHLEDFDKPVMLTFDDGYMDNYTEMFPILQKYNAKATIFAITKSVDRNEKTITSQQAREMMDSGLVSIQSHTYSHPHLSELGREDLEHEMLWSKIHVARMTGYEPFVVCYPYGDSNQFSREVVSEYYQFGLFMSGGTYTTGEGEFTITRSYVPRGMSLGTFASLVSGAGR